MLLRSHSRSLCLLGNFPAVAASVFLFCAPPAISQNSQQPLEDKSALSATQHEHTDDRLAGRAYNENAAQPGIRETKLSHQSGEQIKNTSANVYSAASVNDADVAMSPSNSDSAYNYAFLNNTAMVPKSAILSWLQRKNLVPEHWQAEAKPAFRPFATWTLWINNRVLFFPSASLILIASLLSWYFAPKLMDQAESESEKNYWKSLGTGLLVSVISILLIRSVLSTLIGWPLAIVLIGIMQLFLVLGISVITSMIGRSISFYVKVRTWPWFASRNGAARLCELTIGSVVLALLLQLGSPGGLPRVGTRLALLVAILGTGAISRIIASRKGRA